MKILNEIPPVATTDDFVCLDVENFYEKGSKAHRPVGTFASLSITYGDGIVYQIYDEKQIAPTLKNLDKATWVFHNALYDLRKLMLYAKIKPRFIWDTMVVEQSMFGGLYTHYNLGALSRRWLEKVMNKEARDEFMGGTHMTKEMKKYAADDVIETLEIAKLQRKMFESDFAFRAYTEVDEPAIWPLLDMKGIRVDVPGWEKMVVEFTQKAENIQKDLGINVMSAAQVKTKAKEFGYVLQSTGKDILAELDHPFFRSVEEARMYRKASSTYGTKWLTNVEEDGRVYSSYRITGALTGRMSCVSSNTLLRTNRGVFTIKDYDIQNGDHIETHTGDWQPIVRKIYKGKEDMYEVECYNMSVVQCTLNHRLLTPLGWKVVGDLHPNSEVITHVDFEPIRKQQSEYRKGPAPLFGGPPQVWLSADSRRTGNFLSQCRLYYKDLCRWGAKILRTNNPNVPSKNGRKESHEGRDRGGASEVQGIGFRWTWLSDAISERKESSGASSSNGGVSWIGRIASLFGCSSHRRGQNKQFTGQSGTGYEKGSREVTSEISKIRTITYLGKMDVWDIEVANDHSYIAGGLIHHNSAEPNMQNIPARKLPIYRSRFIASEGKVIMVSDVSQQEPRILAYESQDPVLIDAVKSGEDTHMTVAKSIYGEFDKKDPDYDSKRSVGKTINLGTSYGLSEFGLATKLKITVEAAEKLLRQYFTRFRGVFSWISTKRMEARDKGYVTTAIGRKVYINPYTGYHADNQAINAPIQGGAADFTKVWLRKIWELCRKNKIEYPVVAIVHDEIVCDVPRAIRKMFEVQILMKAFDETAKLLYKGIPFAAETVSGPNWGVKQFHDEAYGDEDEE